jgi:hypothetical protein
MRKYLALLGALCVLAVPASAQAIPQAIPLNQFRFVSPTGVDGYPGTVTAPWRTQNYAVGAAYRCVFNGPYRMNGRRCTNPKEDIGYVESFSIYVEPGTYKEVVVVPSDTYRAVWPELFAFPGSVKDPVVELDGPAELYGIEACFKGPALAESLLVGDVNTCG